MGWEEAVTAGPSHGGMELRFGPRGAGLHSLVTGAPILGGGPAQLARSGRFGRLVVRLLDRANRAPARSRRAG